jgi:hypothetical protein
MQIQQLMLDDRRIQPPATAGGSDLTEPGRRW